jgi:hypothetical protein
VYTYYANRNFSGASDTVTVYTAIATVKQGTTKTLDSSLDRAFKWYNDNLRPGCTLKLSSCCTAMADTSNRTGNVDCDDAKGVDISDLSRLIDNLYVSFGALCCDYGANIDGDPCNGVDISDLSGLIDYLYVSFTLPAFCR